MLSQIAAITGLNLKSIPERWGSSLVIVVGLAGVVAVFCALLAMASGFEKTLASTGRTDNAIVLRGGSDTELNSGLGRDETTLVKQAPGVRKGADGKPLASAEMIVIAELVRQGDANNGANITVRGVEADGFTLRPQLKIVEGRRFQTGLRELIVGRGVTRQFQGAGIGDTVRMRGSDWKVVGIFESGDAHDSELWADADVAQTTFNRRGYSSVLVGLDGAAGLRPLKDALQADPRLTVDVKDEQSYFSGQTKNFRNQIGFLAGFVTVIMALGAIFAALNTMYAAVAARGREIATLRAIGFGGVPVVVSVLIESLVLALVGGLGGAIIAYLLFNNYSVSTLGENFTQVVFAFKVTPQLVGTGLVIAVAIGLLGGVFPAASQTGTFMRRQMTVAVALGLFTAVAVGLVSFMQSGAVAGLVAFLGMAVVQAVAVTLGYFLVKQLLARKLRGPMSLGLRLLLTMAWMLALPLGFLFLSGLYVIWTSSTNNLVSDPMLANLRAA
jgi:putative ABC transport system permease protein